MCVRAHDSTGTSSSSSSSTSLNPPPPEKYPPARTTKIKHKMQLYTAEVASTDNSTQNHEMLVCKHVRSYVRGKGKGVGVVAFACGGQGSKKAETNVALLHVAVAALGAQSRLRCCKGTVCADRKHPSFSLPLPNPVLHNHYTRLRTDVCARDALQSRQCKEARDNLPCGAKSSRRSDGRRRSAQGRRGGWCQ